MASYSSEELTDLDIRKLTFTNYSKYPYHYYHTSSGFISYEGGWNENGTGVTEWNTVYFKIAQFTQAFVPLFHQEVNTYRSPLPGITTSFEHCPWFRCRIKNNNPPMLFSCVRRDSHAPKDPGYTEDIPTLSTEQIYLRMCFCPSCTEVNGSACSPCTSFIRGYISQNTTVFATK